MDNKKAHAIFNKIRSLKPNAWGYGFLGLRLTYQKIHAYIFTLKDNPRINITMIDEEEKDGKPNSKRFYTNQIDIKTRHIDDIAAGIIEEIRAEYSKYKGVKTQ